MNKRKYGQLRSAIVEAAIGYIQATERLLVAETDEDVLPSEYGSLAEQASEAYDALRQCIDEYNDFVKPIPATPSARSHRPIPDHSLSSQDR